MNMHDRVARTRRSPARPSNTMVVSARSARKDVIQLPNMQEITYDVEEAAGEFPWFRDEHRAEASTYLSSLPVARQHGLDQQVELYMAELQRIVTTDVKERVVVWAQEALGFPKFTYYHPPEQRLSAVRFNGQQVVQQGTTYQWVYYPMEEFSRLIPPHALQALAQLEATGIQPQAYWVADLQHVALPRWTFETGGTLDPVLCAQFHRWFVGIAAWV